MKQTLLLIDEIDKADIEFPNDLLQEIDTSETLRILNLRKLRNLMNKKIVLEKDYIPNEEEPFMSDKQLEYFRKKLLDWKSEILDGAQDTIKGMQTGTRNIPDAADRASEHPSALLI